MPYAEDVHVVGYFGREPEGLFSSISDSSWAY